MPKPATRRCPKAVTGKRNPIVYYNHLLKEGGQGDVDKDGFLRGHVSARQECLSGSLTALCRTPLITPWVP